MARLKVFSTPMGFHEAVVAAPSQKTALAALGVRENLFASGMAAVTDDPVAVKAALARPGVVLRRPIGGKGGFSETPEAPPAPKGAKVRRKPADRRALDTVEKALAAFERRRATELEKLEKARAVLDARAAKTRERLEAEAAKLEAEQDAARDAFRRAGGRT